MHSICPSHVLAATPTVALPTRCDDKHSVDEKVLVKGAERQSGESEWKAEDGVEGGDTGGGVGRGSKGAEGQHPTLTPKLLQSPDSLHPLLLSSGTEDGHSTTDTPGIIGPHSNALTLSCPVSAPVLCSPAADDDCRSHLIALRPQHKPLTRRSHAISHLVLKRPQLCGSR